MKYKVWGKAKVMLKPQKHHFETISIVLFLLALLIVLTIVVRMGMLYAGSIYSGVREPYIQSLSADSVVIRWQSEERFIGKIVLARTAGASEIKMTEKFAKESHEIQLTGLEPATRYYYRLYHDQQVFRDGLEYWFETAPEKGSNKSVRLWVIGNPGANSQNSHLVQNGMLKWVEKNPRSDKSLLNMIVSTGNNAYDDASNDEYQKYLFSVQEDLFKNFVFWPTYGEIDANGWAFFNIFSLPKNAESGGVASDSERYYSVDYGSLHMIFLDSYEGAYTAEDDMLRWLKKDLKNTNQKWVITFMNHAPYTRGSHNSDDHRDSSNRMFNMRKHVIPLLEDAGVDMVITGHSYSYERSYLVNCHYGVSSDFTRSMIVQKGPEFIKPGNKKSHQGAVYTVLGSSALSADGRFDHPVMATSSVETGSMIIDLEKEKLSAYFINDKAEVIDQFEITKNLTAPIYKSQCQ